MTPDGGTPHDSQTRSVLFVCMGNICRSPAGESLFRAFVSREGVAERVRVDSAGTIGYHAGERPDSRMRAAAAARGVEISGRARQIERQDLESFDLIVAMDRDNHADILELAGGEATHVRLLGEFLADASPRDVPDPYYGGARGFNLVLDMIEEACPAILRHVLPERR